MKKLSFLVFCSSLFYLNLFAQTGNVGIGTNSPDQSAQLDVFASDKGVLFPRVDLAAASFPGGPAEGLLVWNNNAAYGNGVGYYVNVGSKSVPNWLRLETESNSSIEDIGVIVGYPGSTYPNDVYLPLSGGTFNDADYPEFAAFIPNLDADVVTDNGNGTFTLGNWNTNGEFLRGQGGNAAALGSLQSDATSLPSNAFTTNTAGDHSHTVDPPSTSTSTDGSHNHDFYTANNDVNSTTSQGYPNADNHLAFRTTDRVQRTEDNGAIRPDGAHSHTVDIASFNSGTAGSHSHTVNGGGDAETRPVNRSVLWLIKVKSSSVIADTLIINNITNTPTVLDADWHVSRTTNSPSSINDNIYSGGNVGIGDFAPAASNDPEDPFHIKTSGGTRGLIETTSNNFAGLRYRNTNREYFAGISGGTDRFVIYDNNVASERVSVEPDGELRANFGLQVGGGSSMNNIQAGTLTIGGTTSGGFKVVTLTFPTAFSSIPIVVATPRTETGQTHNDNFSVTTRTVTTTSVTFNVERTDATSDWGQNLLLDWIAIGL